jgi:hypothetical protein
MKEDILIWMDDVEWDWRNLGMKWRARALDRANGHLLGRKLRSNLKGPY